MWKQFGALKFVVLSINKTYRCGGGLGFEFGVLSIVLIRLMNLNGFCHDNGYLIVFCLHAVQDGFKKWWKTLRQ